MLIRAYAQLWNPDTVDWGKQGPGNKGQLLGKVQRKGKTHKVNFWDAKGIYVLHADFKAVYVGKATVVASWTLGATYLVNATTRDTVPSRVSSV